MAHIVERRLPAIYDALDSRNNKVLGYKLYGSSSVAAKTAPTNCVCAQLALKLINNALQKQSKSQILRVLKAIALQRTGKDEEGLQVWLT